MKLKLLILTLGLTLCSSLFGLSAWDTIPPNFDKKLLQFIIVESMNNGIEPELIFALINAESEWKASPPSRNRNGTYDYGLMRLNGAYLEEYIWRYGKPGKKYDLKNNNYDNVEIGIKHFATLYRLCDRNALLALYSYNCGFTRTKEGRIPASTREYASTVLAVYDPSNRFSTD